MGDKFISRRHMNGDCNKEMMILNIFSHTLMMVILLFLSACSGLPNRGSEEPTSTKSVAEAATETEEVLATQSAQAAIVETPPIILSAVPVPSETATETSVPKPTFTPIDTATIWTLPPFPTQTPLKTPTPLKTFVSLPPCDFVEVTDITVEAGSDFAPLEQFVKTWRFKNIGSCPWTTSYAVVFLSGYDMSGSGSLNLPNSVPPGQSVDVSINMEAPAAENNYVGYWMLRNASGKTFGIGPTASIPFAVEIDVLGYLPVSYHFAQKYCQATWTSAAGILPCPDTDKDSDQKGFVRKLEKPQLETGAFDNEPVILTHPQMVNNGYISGKFPAYTIQSGEHFYTVLTCQFGAINCDVIFWIKYQITGSSTIQSLGNWNEKYDDSLTYIDIDLTPLVGKSVIFILTVESNGSYNQDEAFWLAPVIDKP